MSSSPAVIHTTTPDAPSTADARVRTGGRSRASAMRAIAVHTSAARARSVTGEVVVPGVCCGPDSGRIAGGVAVSGAANEVGGCRGGQEPPAPGRGRPHHPPSPLLPGGGAVFFFCRGFGRGGGPRGPLPPLVGRRALARSCLGGHGPPAKGA